MPPERDSLRPIAMVGAFPPPVNGYAVITSSVEALLRDWRRTFRLDISPGTSKRGLRYHTTRVSRVALTAVRLIGIRWRIGAFDTYIATESRTGLLYTIVLASLARLLGSRIYLHHHVFRYIDRHSRLMEMLLSITGVNATHFFLCQCMRKAFSEQYDPPIASAIVSNLAFAEVPADQLPRKQDQTLTVGLLSNLTREKGLYEFLALAACAARSGVPARFVLAGPTSNKKDAEAIARMVGDNAPSLTYLGPVFGDDKAHFYSDIDIFLFPTNYANEAQPMVVFEALAHGCLVIAFDRACIEEQVASRGWIIPKTENFVEAALQRLESLVQDMAALGATKQEVARSVRAEYFAAQKVFTELLGRPTTDPANIGKRHIERGNA